MIGAIRAPPIIGLALGLFWWMGSEWGLDALDRRHPCIAVADPRRRILAILSGVDKVVIRSRLSNDRAFCAHAVRS